MDSGDLTKVVGISLLLLQDEAESHEGNFLSGAWLNTLEDKRHNSDSTSNPSTHTEEKLPAATADPNVSSAPTKWTGPLSSEISQDHSIFPVPFLPVLQVSMAILTKASIHGCDQHPKTCPSSIPYLYSVYWSPHLDVLLNSTCSKVNSCSPPSPSFSHMLINSLTTGTPMSPPSFQKYT